MTDGTKQQTERCDYITDSPYFKGQMLKCNLPMGHDGQHILIADNVDLTGKVSYLND